MGWIENKRREKRGKILRTRMGLDGGYEKEVGRRERR